MTLTIDTQNHIVHIIIIIVGFILIKPIVFELIKRVFLLKSPRKLNSGSSETYLQSFDKSCKNCNVKH